MPHRKTYMYINFQQNRVSRSVKTVHTNLFAKNCKLHKFATCNSNFENLLLSDMSHNYPYISRFYNQPASRSLRTAFQIYFYRRRTDGRTDIASDYIRYFFFATKKILKTEHSEVTLMSACQSFSTYWNARLSFIQLSII